MKLSNEPTETRANTGEYPGWKIGRIARKPAPMLENVAIFAAAWRSRFAYENLRAVSNKSESVQFSWRHGSRTLPCEPRCQTGYSSEPRRQWRQVSAGGGQTFTPALTHGVIAT